MPIAGLRGRVSKLSGCYDYGICDIPPCEIHQYGPKGHRADVGHILFMYAILEGVPALFRSRILDSTSAPSSRNVRAVHAVSAEILSGTNSVTARNASHDALSGLPSVLTIQIDTLSARTETKFCGKQ